MQKNTTEIKPTNSLSFLPHTEHATSTSTMTPGDQSARSSNLLSQLAMQNNATETKPTNSAPPFKEFQQVLAFISSLGLATAASCAFSLVGITSSFGDSGDAAKAQIKKSGLFLSWASACFIVSIGFVAATQLLYTEPVIIQVLGKKETRPEKVIIRVGLACFAWTALGFQTAAMVLLGQSLRVFAHGPVYLANFGLVASAVLVVLVTLVGMRTERKGRKKLSILWTLGGLLPRLSRLGKLFGSKEARSSGGMSAAADDNCAEI